MKLRREHILSIISGVLTVALFVSLLWGYSQQQQKQRALAYLEYEYQRAYYGYMADLRDLAATAGKVQSASALQRTLLLGEMSALSRSAADNLAALPIQQMYYQQSAGFINQIGDYSLSLAEQLGRGKQIEAEDQKTLTTIYEKLTEIHDSMLEMENAVADGTISFASAVQDDSLWTTLRRSLGGARTVQGEAAAVADTSADGFMTRANSLLDDSEPLQYQGRYSTHLDEREALGFASAERIEVEEAEKIADQFLQYVGIEGLVASPGEEIEIESAIPLYSFLYQEGEGPIADNPNLVYVTVSQVGGQVISYYSEHAPGERSFTVDQALSHVENLLRRAGYESMKLVGREQAEGYLYLKYVHYANDVLYYPDSVSVKVSLENGVITSLNAREFWMSHTERTMPEELSLAEDAIATLGEQAVVESSALAYISTAAGNEVLCHEILHTVGEEQYLSYVGVEEMQEEQVLRSYSSQDGSFYTR